MKTVIVGDIHGCYDELCALLEKIEFDIEKFDLIFLGDLMDRGPKSYEVFCAVKDLKSKMGERCVIIRGNHEQMLCDYYREADKDWLFNGCVTTIDSFEAHEEDPCDCVDWIENNTMYYYIDEDFNCCHAGTFYSDITVNHYSTLIWDRDAFEYSDYEGKATFIGHTPLYYPVRSRKGYNHEKLNYMEKVPIGSGLINIDTGAVFGGQLTAAVYDPADKTFILYNVGND